MIAPRYIRRAADIILGPARSSRRGDPLADFARYRSCADAIGFHGPQLFLSFDCDTDWDIEVVADLDQFLRERGIAATYAVPGAQLERGREIYGTIAASGREFINHGARPHAAWDGDRYVPITFYNEMDAAAVVDDIRSGHEIVVAVTGRPPAGFRAPHFGSFQDDDQLNLIYKAISSLGYRYATTTIPAKALAHGPAYRAAEGITEIPCFGSLRYPTTILDSWTYLVDRRQYTLGPIYAELWRETLDAFCQTQFPVLLTWYADPSHVWKQPAFHRAIDELIAHAVPSLSGGEVADILAGIECNKSA